MIAIRVEIGDNLAAVMFPDAATRTARLISYITESLERKARSKLLAKELPGIIDEIEDGIDVMEIT